MLIDEEIKFEYTVIFYVSLFYCTRKLSEMVEYFQKYALVNDMTRS